MVSALLLKSESVNNKKATYMLSLSRAKLMAPVPKPRAIYCLARNYYEHILEFNERVVEQDKMVPPYSLNRKPASLVRAGLLSCR